MTRRLLILDLVLVLFAAGLVWLLRDRYRDARARERAVLNQRIAPKAVMTPPSPAPVRPAPPADYLDVAQKMLFSKDRNPNVVVEPPKPAPEPPMPALPIYHGQMAIGEPIAFLSLASQAATQKGYHAGEKVGEFVLVGFDAEKIELEWHGKKIERKPEELVAKEPTPQAPAAAGPSAPAGAGNPAAGLAPRPPALAGPEPPAPAPAKAVTSLGPAASAEPSGMGDEIGPGVRNCAPGDDSPAGTVLNGYTKRMIPSMFGSVCRWEQAK